MSESAKAEGDRVIVVGGGASGMMAAGRAAACGGPVLLLERTRRLGNKLRLTGNGRCNLTNSADMAEFVGHFGANAACLYSVFSRFFKLDLIEFLKECGVSVVEEQAGRIFPTSGGARSVVRALEMYLQQGQVTVRYGARVTAVRALAGQVSGVAIGDEFIPARAVVLATGGASYPGTGSTGDGYRLAASLGHGLAPIRPALVPLVVAEDWVADLQGLALREVQVSLLSNGTRIARESGDLLFTQFGVSGPTVLALSGRAVDCLSQGKVALSICMKPALSVEVLEQSLQKDFDRLGKRIVTHILEGWLPGRMAEVLAQRSGILAERRGHQITSQERKWLVGLLQDFRLSVVGVRPLEEAIITAGGVLTSEIDFRTMSSRLVRGLYFCGEVVDLQADTGGYNLQAAFSMGYVAGESAALYVLGSGHVGHDGHDGGPVR